MRSVDFRQFSKGGIFVLPGEGAGHQGIPWEELLFLTDKITKS